MDGPRPSKRQKTEDVHETIDEDAVPLSWYYDTIAAKSIPRNKVTEAVAVHDARTWQLKMGSSGPAGPIAIEWAWKSPDIVGRKNMVVWKLPLDLDPTWLGMWT